LVGFLEMRQSQAEQLGVKAHSRLRGGLENASLRLSANASFQDAEADIAALTGMNVGRQSFEPVEAKQGVSEVSIDGGKVRLRDLVDSPSHAVAITKPYGCKEFTTAPSFKTMTA
jgi:hypothetical protein